jgi:hypothetical protein
MSSEHRQRKAVAKHVTGMEHSSFHTQCGGRGGYTTRCVVLDAISSREGGEQPGQVHRGPSEDRRPELARCDSRQRRSDRCFHPLAYDRPLIAALNSCVGAP